MNSPYQLNSPYQVDAPASAPQREAMAPGAAAQCYALARRNFPESKIGLVTRALKVWGIDEVFRRIEEAVETGDDLGHALWVPETLGG